MACARCRGPFLIKSVYWVAALDGKMGAVTCETQGTEGADTVEGESNDSDWGDFVS
jgi:hypothetical protein